MQRSRTANVPRTALLTLAAVFWGDVVGNGRFPDVELGPLEPVALILVLLVTAAFPVMNIVFAVRDARAIESGAGGRSAWDILRWLVTLACVVINFVLVGLAFLIGVMLVSGPIVP